ncbi:hypothetical protein emb_1d0397 [Coriobacteriaceae bacterium EMTCatB1]|nr:hypothetical protein emb_1d0397 [Coriobacteriaceae bacterium EMTCatB1]
MRVLIAHNEYSVRGGEETVVETEARLLRDAGVDVRILMLSSRDFSEGSLWQQAFTVLSSGRMSPGRLILRDAIRRYEPDVVHFHNLYPMFGSGAVEEAAKFGCGTVRTLHNYRLSCIAGTHFRDGRVCEKCTVTKRFHGVAYGCYRGSRTQSLAMAMACAAEWRLITERNLPDVLICLTEFARKRLIEAGVPDARLVVKANSVDAGKPLRWEDREGACFVGRLSEEKGVLELAAAWPADGPRLTIAGDGPLRDQIESVCREKQSLVYVGALDRDRVRLLVRSSLVLVLPSLCWEGLPTVALEALSEGTPFVSFSQTWNKDLQSHLDYLTEVRPGDFSGLVAENLRIASLGQEDWTEASGRALDVYRRHFTHECNRDALLGAYELAVALAGARR